MAEGVKFDDDGKISACSLHIWHGNKVRYPGRMPPRTSACCHVWFALYHRLGGVISKRRIMPLFGSTNMNGLMLSQASQQSKKKRATASSSLGRKNSESHTPTPKTTRKRSRSNRSDTGGQRSRFCNMCAGVEGIPMCAYPTTFAQNRYLCILLRVIPPFLRINNIAQTQR